MRHWEVYDRYCTGIVASIGRRCRNLASFLGRCNRHPLEGAPAKPNKDHDLSCASLRPTKCDCNRGAWRRMRRKAANHFKRAKVDVIEVKND